MGSSRVIECVYEDGVFKPLGKVDLKQGTRLLIRVGRADLTKYWGILGKASAENSPSLKKRLSFDIRYKRIFYKRLHSSP